MPTRSAPSVAQHPDLGRRLVVRPGQLRRTRPRSRLGSTARRERAQPAAVEVGEVDEVAPARASVAVRLRWSAISTGWPGAQAGAQPAAAVGQHDDPAAGRGRGPHAVHDRVDAAALVEVRAAEEHQHASPTGIDRADPPGVAGDGRRREAGQVGHRDVGVGVADRVRRPAPSRSRAPSRRRGARRRSVRPAAPRPVPQPRQWSACSTLSPARSSSTEVSPTDLHGRSRSSFT